MSRLSVHKAPSVIDSQVIKAGVDTNLITLDTLIQRRRSILKNEGSTSFDLGLLIHYFIIIN